MSLARSASGPSGLTINTNAANSLSTPATQPNQAGSLFGGATTTTPSTTTTAAPAAGGTAMASTGGGLFGAAQQQKPAGGLFGASTTANTGGSSVFGGGNQAATQQPQAGAGGLFGAGAAANTTQTQQPMGAGGLFGNAGAQQQGQQQPQQQQQQQAGGGLFGASTTTNTATGGTGLFGAPTAANTAAGGAGVFGQAQPAKPAGGLFGASTQQMQQQQPQQQAANQSTNQIPAVQINYDNLRPRTRFDDLAKPIQDEIALIDKGIARVIKMKDEIGEFMPQHERDIEQLGRDVKFVESKFRTVQVALNSDIQAVKTLQDMSKKNIGDAQLSFKATDNLKLPAHYHLTGLFATPATAASSGNSPAGNTGASAADTHADAQDLITYFNRICDDVEKYKRRIDEYRGEIERDMPGVENGLYDQIRALRDRQASSGGDSGIADQLGQVLLALREMGTAIINQAGQIADTRERLSRLQAGIVDSGVYAMGTA